MAYREHRIRHLLSKNVEQIIDRTHLASALRSRKKLRVKLGVDPTGANIHLGFAVVLWKLKEFQDLGHTIVLIIGDVTAQIGDPSDKLEKRPLLSRAEIKKNLTQYLPQIGKILNLKKTEVRYNSEWLSKLTFQEISQLAEQFTLQQMIRRRNFSERLKKDQEISLREMFYPLMQGYDSVAVKADVELGGSDQLFNLFAGRKIQARYGQRPQDVVTTKMLVGTDGRKMSKTWGNVIQIADPPQEQYGKIMAMHDRYILEYFTLATDVPDAHMKKIGRELGQGKNPKNAKERLGFEIVKRYHGAEAAKKAAHEFEQLFSKKEILQSVPALRLPKKTIVLLDLVMKSRIAKSKSQARRLIIQGGVKINGVARFNPLEKLMLQGGEILKIGKRHFLKIT